MPPARLQHRRALRQRAARRHRVALEQMRIVELVDKGERLQRQAEADRAVAGDQEQPAAPRAPFLGHPAHAAPTAAAIDQLALGDVESRPLPGLHRQHPAGRGLQTAVEHARQPGPLLRIVDLIVDRVDVRRQLALAQHELGRVLEGGLGVVGIDLQRLRQKLREPPGGAGVERRPAQGRRRLRRDQVGVLPKRFAILAPDQGERPARQLFARIPFALAVMQQPARGETVAQPADQLVGVGALGRAHRFGVPLIRVAIGGGHEGRLAAHGQPHIAGLQLVVDGVAPPTSAAPSCRPRSAW